MLTYNFSSFLQKLLKDLYVPIHLMSTNQVCTADMPIPLTAENSTFALKVPLDHTVAVLEQFSTSTHFSATNQKTYQDGAYFVTDFIFYFLLNLYTFISQRRHSQYIIKTLALHHCNISRIHHFMPELHQKII